MIKFKLNGQGVRELMQSPEMVSVLKEYGNEVLASCGEGYKADSHVGRTRANVSVWPDSWKARGENYKYNTLLKALK